MQPRKPIVCGLSARGIIPPLPQADMVEISDEEVDVVELTHEEYMRNMDYLIRIEESEDDIEPEFRRMLQRMNEEVKKQSEQKVKLEEGQSSKGDGKKRKRRS
ncbi:hypothetical protein N665_0463s0011 [Sinapis alba]|nr:hypothetical protein N665_0463s0011 [Sinapis alba]